MYAMGKAYGQPPSRWFPGMSEIEAFTLDYLALQQGAIEEKRQTDRVANRARRR